MPKLNLVTVGRDSSFPYALQCVPQCVVYVQYVVLWYVSICNAPEWRTINKTMSFKLI